MRPDTGDRPQGGVGERQEEGRVSPLRVPQEGSARPQDPGQKPVIWPADLWPRGQRRGRTGAGSERESWAGALGLWAMEGF